MGLPYSLLWKGRISQIKTFLRGETVKQPYLRNHNPYSSHSSQQCKGTIQHVFRFGDARKQGRWDAGIKFSFLRITLTTHLSHFPEPPLTGSAQCLLLLECSKRNKLWSKQKEPMIRNKDGGQIWWQLERLFSACSPWSSPTPAASPSFFLTTLPNQENLITSLALFLSWQ